MIDPHSGSRPEPVDGAQPAGTRLLAGPGRHAAPAPGPEALPAQPDPWSRPATVGGLVIALVAASFLLRLEGLGRWLWIDEGISVGIASHPLSEIPGVLRLDGSPPLYYLLLHAWMVLFGTSELALHALSLIFALMLVPVSLWAGWSLFGRRAGWILAVMAATNPYLSDYAREARMYTLVPLLALVATATFLHAFVFGRRRYLPLFAGSLVLLLYTHNWGLWFAAGAAAALVPCLRSATDRRRLKADASWTFAAVGLLYLPWVPTLVFQGRHTGAPWSATPVPREAVSALSEVLGDPHERVLVALVLVAGAALWQLWRGRRHDVTAATAADTTAATAATALAVLIGVTVGAAWLGAQVRPSWAARYVVICLPPVLLLAALGLARSGTRGLVALGLILLFWTQPLARLSGDRPAVGLDEMATEKVLADAVSPHLRPGDLVVVVQMEEVPVLRYYLPAGLRFATAMGPVEDPRVADWRDALARLEAATPATHLRPLIDEAPVGSRVLLVCPVPEPVDPELAWFELMEERCREWEAALATDPRLARAPVDGAEGWTSALGRAVRLVAKTGP